MRTAGRASGFYNYTMGHSYTTLIQTLQEHLSFNTKDYFRYKAMYGRHCFTITRRNFC